MHRFSSCSIRDADVEDVRLLLLSDARGYAHPRPCRGITECPLAVLSVRSSRVRLSPVDVIRGGFPRGVHQASVRELCWFIACCNPELSSVSTASAASPTTVSSDARSSADQRPST